MVWIGVHPSTFTNPMDRAVTELLETMTRRGADLAAWQNGGEPAATGRGSRPRRRAMIPQIDVAAVAPMMPVALGVLVLPLVDVIAAAPPARARPAAERGAPGHVSGDAPAFGFLAASLLLTLNAFSQPIRVFNPENPMVRMDGVALFLCAIVLIGAMLTVLASEQVSRARRTRTGASSTRSCCRR